MGAIVCAAAALVLSSSDGVLDEPALPQPSEPPDVAEPVAPVAEPAPNAKPKYVPPEDRSDASLLRAVHSTNMTVLAEEPLAAERANSAQVREYVQRLRRDHAQTEKLVVKAAERLGVELGDGMPLDRRLTVEVLRSVPAPDFDRTFLEAASNQHRTLIARVAAAEKADRRVRRLCQQLLPELRREAREAKRLKLTTAKADELIPVYGE